VRTLYDVYIFTYFLSYIHVPLCSVLQTALREALVYRWPRLCICSTPPRVLGFRRIASLRPLQNESHQALQALQRGFSEHFDVADPNAGPEQRMTRAKVMLLVAKLMEQSSSFDSNTVLRQYKEVGLLFWHRVDYLVNACFVNPDHEFTAGSVFLKRSFLD